MEYIKDGMGEFDRGYDILLNLSCSNLDVVSSEGCSQLKPVQARARQQNVGQRLTCNPMKNGI